MLYPSVATNIFAPREITKVCLFLTGHQSAGIFLSPLDEDDLQFCLGLVGEK